MNVYIQKIITYDLNEIKQFLEITLQKIDFFSKIKDKKNVLLKPNLLGAYKPEAAVTTHPIIIEALIQILIENNKNVALGDSPGGAVFVGTVWEKTGIKKLCEKYDIKLLNFSEGRISKHSSINKKFTISEYFFEADAVINLPKYKTHSLMYYTGAIKNLYGIIPGLKKSDYHKNYPTISDFSEVITDLYSIAREKVVLNILDGIWGMEDEGPSAGITRNFGIMMVSEKASALDHIASRMFGFKDSQLMYISKAMEIDNILPDDIEIDNEWKDFKFKDVKIKKVSAFVKILSYSPKIFQNFFKKHFEFKPDFNGKCVLCNVCVQSCPVQAMTLNKGDKHPEIDYEKCIKCMCCHELCPHQAVYINKSFLAKFIIK
ncbi:MAG: DUF362 domain-containing protein [Candidatus Cloacimonetes bacterium]|nr:DUF362 domain-containing protein [Candidatus Cloacimonadota bacterium]